MVPCGTMEMPRVHLHGAFHGFDVVEFHHVLASTPYSFKILSSALRVGDVRLEPDDLLAGERFELHAFQFGERMLRVADEHERIFAERDDLDFRILDRIRDKAEVNDIALHILVNTGWRGGIRRGCSRSDSSS